MDAKGYDRIFDVLDKDKDLHLYPDDHVGIAPMPKEGEHLGFFTIQRLGNRVAPSYIPELLRKDGLMDTPEGGCEPRLRFIEHTEENTSASGAQWMQEFVFEDLNTPPPAQTYDDSEPK